MGYSCAPETSRVDPCPSYLHHTSSFLGSDHGGSATGLVVRFIVSIVPSELLKAYWEEQGQRDHDEDLTGSIRVRELPIRRNRLTRLALRTHNSTNCGLASYKGQGSHYFHPPAKASNATLSADSGLPGGTEGRYPKTIGAPELTGRRPNGGSKGKRENYDFQTKIYRLYR